MVRIDQYKTLPEKPDDPRLKMVKRVTRLMDEQFTIGKFKFGLDPILNFIPVAGDLGGFTVSIALILTMIQYGVSGKVAAKMLGNATFDALIGAIPVLGWIFDFTYKANTKNVKLLTEHYTQGKHQGSAIPVLISFIITAFIIMIALIIVSVIAFSWIISFFWQGN